VAAIVSVDHDAEDVTFRFHGVRPSESRWADDDLDSYEEPVLLRVSD
jgi:hypothetical protein